MTVYNLGPGNNAFVVPGTTNDQVFGEDGNDSIYSDTGSDDLFGGNGDDYLYDGSAGDLNHYYGGEGNDQIFGGPGDFGDIVDGGIGIDRISLHYGAISGFPLSVTMGSAFYVLLGGARAINVQNVEALTIFCTDSGDQVTGGAYDDVIYSFNGNDTLAGRGGNDSFVLGTSGTFLVDGNGGDDKVTVSFAAATGGIQLETGTDTSITVGALSVQFRSIEVLDVRTGSGSDTIRGGTLGDRIDTGAGDDLITAGAGDDTILSGIGADVIYAGVGNDTVNSGSSGDPGTVGKTIFGGDGDDQLGGFNRADMIRGDAGNDRLFGGGGNDSILGGAGNDTIQGGGNDASVSFAGGAGNDVVYVSVDINPDQVSGSSGTDTLVAELEFNSNRNRVMETGFAPGGYRITVDGVQVMLASGFEMVNITGGTKADVLVGGEGNDTLRGFGYNGDAADTDSLSGGAGNDLLFGMAGNDTLNGGKGDDRVVGGLGIDMVTGGDGADVFAIEAVVPGAGLANRDRVRDFVQGTDRIDLSLLDANTLTPGVNDAFDFVEATAFSAVGQVRAETAGGLTTVTGDVNGDGVVDFMFVLDGVFTLTDADFLL